MPRVDVLLTEDAPSPLNPLGIKSAGEGGITAVGATIASAIDDAIGVPGRGDLAARDPAAGQSALHFNSRHCEERATKQMPSDRSAKGSRSLAMTWLMHEPADAPKRTILAAYTAAGWWGERDNLRESPPGTRERRRARSRCATASAG